ncbi:MAG TPA: TonB-dependent receptor [Steroidobacteraceae bacterium]|jgi:iron complex outermembrane receptor protein|nr:TonB-dependent receptor [Steroidobacteraceae bacterium]
MNLKSGYAGSHSISAAVRRALLAAAVAATALPASQVLAQEPDEALEEVIVTGSILRRTDAETPSPVTVISSDELAQRGINTVSDAVQRLSANNAGTITAGWNTGFNFASGATAPALRGLTVQNTLSVADGLRMAAYPLADDGQRNFVDLNTIPSAIVDRIEVLRDGASSTYGADAIAGVVNIITKKEIKGLHLGGSTALSEAGGGDENHIDVTWGMGSLESDGYNFYISGEYQKQDPLWARDRGYPFNSTDLSRKCGPSGSCMTNLNFNGVTAELGDTPESFNGLLSIPGVSLVRPIADPVATAGDARYQYLDPAAGCRQWPTVNITPNQSDTAPLSVCEINIQSAYIMLQPEIQRSGLSLRFTANVGENAQFYTMANFYKTDTSASFTPLGFTGSLPPPNPADLAAANVNLPVYVCSQGVGTFNGVGTGCDASNGTLNPQNPFAGAGERAQLLLRSPYGRAVDTSSRAIRAVAGIDGSFGEGGWRYSGNFTTSEIGLTQDQGNFPIPQRIWDLAARGTFNFSDPYANSKETWDYIAPVSSEYNTSRLWQLQGTIAKDLLDLPGGAMQAALGVSYREESITSPSANPANLSSPYDRYYSINAVGTSGSRDVKSAFFELNAPVFKQLELVASGRFDDYSTGQSNFSPKFGFKFTPIEQIAFRGTYSKGFRIPSFNESFGLPTTGFVSRATGCGAAPQTFPAFCAAHNNNAYAANAYTLGLTQTGNPELDPEKSTSFTAGLVFEPMTNLALTVDYWQIEVKNLITGVTDTSAVEEAYYANNGVVNIPGFTVTAGTPDPAFPNALPVLGFVETSFTNQNKQEVSGIDFGANLTLPLGDTVSWRSSIDASFLAKYELTTDDGDVLRYDGTLSPCNITSCSGTPKWRGSWQNTFEIGKAAVSLTAYYTSGYDTASIDFGGIKGDCQGNADAAASTLAYVDGSPVLCNAKPTWNADLTARYKFSDKYTVYADVLNVFDIAPPFEPSAAYNLFQFNPAWAGPNIMGRYFRVGAKFDF